MESSGLGGADFAQDSSFDHLCKEAEFKYEMYEPLPQLTFKHKSLRSSCLPAHVSFEVDLNLSCVDVSFYGAMKRIGWKRDSLDAMMLSCDALKFVHNVKASAARNRDDLSILDSLAIMKGSISFTVIDENDFHIVGLCKNGSDCADFAL